MKNRFTILFCLVLAPSFLFAQYTSNKGDRTYIAKNMLSVKFKDGSGVLVNQQNIGLPGGEAFSAELAGMGQWRKSHQVPAEKLTEWRNKAMHNLKRYLPDPNMSCFFVVNDPANLDRAKELIALNELVERVLYVPISVDAVTPDFQLLQAYLPNTNSGINAEAVWSTYNNRGAGIKVCDIEYYFNATHQDLDTVIVLGPQPEDPFGTNLGDHGTAVLGEIASINNGWGTTGIASDCDLYFAGAYTDGNYDLAAAIFYALSELGEGDVILLEQQIAGPNYVGGTDQFGLVPVEWYQPYFDAIVLAVGQNITVVEAAGNGQQDLDAPEYGFDNDGHYPFLDETYTSGAIIVGAGAVDPLFGGGDVARSRLWYSNYGSRVDLQGNGQAVVTTGYGNSYDDEGYDLWYTESFGGTSSASPIVTGAAVLLQSVYKNTTGTALNPDMVKHFLKITAQPQQAGDFPLSQKIGPLPDIYEAIQLALSQAGITEKENGQQTIVYPNPGNGIFNFVFGTSNSRIEIFNAFGEKVHQQEVYGNSAQIDLMQQAEGVYLVKSFAGDKTTTSRIVIAR